ncbi:hypothetical protein NIASO_04835 [Niabella soli DSM 19437]|uniref:Uncharacterized protein n=1 Tax=Niabella soli DSM 19437 TaxID=929713 RepID=W0F2K2_9BACT|nr:hypothetical protein NIASO_04835 [Niabella soli DSM 19437]
MFSAYLPKTKRNPLSALAKDKRHEKKAIIPHLFCFLSRRDNPLVARVTARFGGVP